MDLILSLLCYTAGLAPAIGSIFSFMWIYHVYHEYGNITVQAGLIAIGLGYAFLLFALLLFVRNKKKIEPPRWPLQTLNPGETIAGKSLCAGFYNGMFVLGIAGVAAGTWLAHDFWFYFFIKFVTGPVAMLLASIVMIYPICLAMNYNKVRFAFPLATAEPIHVAEADATVNV